MDSRFNELAQAPGAAFNNTCLIDLNLDLQWNSIGNSKAERISLEERNGGVHLSCVTCIPSSIISLIGPTAHSIHLDIDEYTRKWNARELEDLCGGSPL